MDKKKTLLHVLMSWAKDKEPDLLLLDEDLVHSSEASQWSLTDLKQQARICWRAGSFEGTVDNASPEHLGGGDGTRGEGGGGGLFYYALAVGPFSRMMPSGTYLLLSSTVWR